MTAWKWVQLHSKRSRKVKTNGFVVTAWYFVSLEFWLIVSISRLFTINCFLYLKHFATSLLIYQKIELWKLINFLRTIILNAEISDFPEKFSLEIHLQTLIPVNRVFETYMRKPIRHLDWIFFNRKKYQQNVEMISSIKYLTSPNTIQLL